MFPRKPCGLDASHSDTNPCSLPLATAPCSTSQRKERLAREIFAPLEPRESHAWIIFTIIIVIMIMNTIIIIKNSQPWHRYCRSRFDILCLPRIPSFSTVYCDTVRTIINQSRKCIIRLEYYFISSPVPRWMTLFKAELTVVVPFKKNNSHVNYLGRYLELTKIYIKKWLLAIDLSRGAALNTE